MRAPLMRGRSTTKCPDVSCTIPVSERSIPLATSPSVRRLAADSFAHFAKRFECVDARVVAVAEVDGVRVVTYGFHSSDPQRLGFGRGDDRELQRRWRRSVAFFATGGAGAAVAKVAEGVFADVRVGPRDAEAVRGGELEFGGSGRHYV